MSLKAHWCWKGFVSMLISPPAHKAPLKTINSSERIQSSCSLIYVPLIWDTYYCWLYLMDWIPKALKPSNVMLYQHISCFKTSVICQSICRRQHITAAKRTLTFQLQLADSCWIHSLCWMTSFTSFSKQFPLFADVIPLHVVFFLIPFGSRKCSVFRTLVTCRLRFCF